MKKFIILILTFISLFSVTVFANESVEFNTEATVTTDGEIIPGLIPISEDMVSTLANPDWVGEPAGYYINGDGVAARRPYGLSAPIIGRFYTGDIVWTKMETKQKDGYTWLHVDADTNSNLGKTPDLWIVIHYLGSQYMSLED